MKKSILTTIILCLLGSTIIAQEFTLDQILDKHFKATGYDKLLKVNTIIMTGTMTKQTTMPLRIIRMRPDKYKMENDVQDILYCQSYDGKTAWEILTPYTGNTTPQNMKPEAVKDIIAKADFDGVIYYWKEKGHQAELIGKEKFNDSEVYKIKLTRKDGSIENYIIDCKNFMLVKKSRKLMYRGKEVENVSIFSDFRDVGGIKFPFVNENFMDGRFYSSIEYDTIEVNKKIDEKIFEMPLK